VVYELVPIEPVADCQTELYNDSETAQNLDGPMLDRKCDALR